MRRCCRIHAWCGRLAVAGALALAPACTSSGVTSSKLEPAVARTFANLIHVQEEKLGGPPVDAASLRATASCQKLPVANETSDARGAGSWRCTMTWFVPGHAAPVRDTYDLSVTTDGCFTATADGAEAHIGGPMLKTLSGVTVTNLLYAFDGCFDPT